MPSQIGQVSPAALSQTVMIICIILAFGLANSSQLFDRAKLVSTPCLSNTRSAKGFGFPVGIDPAEKAQ